MAQVDCTAVAAGVDAAVVVESTAVTDDRDYEPEPARERWGPGETPDDSAAAARAAARVAVAKQVFAAVVAGAGERAVSHEASHGRTAHSRAQIAAVRGHSRPPPLDSPAQQTSPSAPGTADAAAAWRIVRRNHRSIHPTHTR